MLNRIKASLKYRMDLYPVKVMNLFRENLVWYTCSHYYSLGYYRLTSKSYNFKDKPVDLSTISSVALIFSKRHFNPENDDVEKKQYSVSNISRYTYNLFKGKKIYYFDHSESIGEIPKVDLVVGLVSKNYRKIASANPQAKRVLSLVNSHPLFRLRVMLEESRRLGKLFPFSEFVSPMLFLKSLAYTDMLVTNGNEFVRNTYIQYGIKPNAITLTENGVNTFMMPNTSKRPKDKIRILYSVSDLGIRKGLFRVFQVWEALMRAAPHDFELYIVGGIDKFKPEFDAFLAQYPSVVFVGWIDSNKPQYRELLQSCHSILGLSIEEGQMGCILDAMACGALPVITEECGVAITNGVNGYIIRHDDIPDIVSCLLALRDTTTRERMERESLQLIKNKYTWDNFTQALQKAITTQYSQTSQ